MQSQRQTHRWLNLVLGISRYLEGCCTCGDLQFELLSSPLFVHACHCLDCQRKTGSAFGITCIVLEDDISITGGELIKQNISVRSTAHMCQNCSSTIHISSKAYPATTLLQTGMLKDLRLLHIEAHIWVKRKHPWVKLPAQVPQFDESYIRDQTWPETSLSRLQMQISGTT